MTSPTDYAGPGETPHDYHPDVMAMGDCSVCGHTYAAHFPPASLPQPEELVERLVAYAGPVRMDNGCGGDLAAEAADAITSLSQRLAVAEASLADVEAERDEWKASAMTASAQLAKSFGVEHLGWLETWKARAEAAEAALAHAREAAIEECAKVADEHAAEWKAQAWDAVPPLQVNQAAQMQHLAAIQIAKALRAIQGSGKP